MISAATVRMTTCRKVKPNKIESLRSTFAGTRARIGASASRRAIGAHPLLSGRVRPGGDGRVLEWGGGGPGGGCGGGLGGRGGGNGAGGSPAGGDGTRRGRLRRAAERGGGGRPRRCGEGRVGGRGVAEARRAGGGRD